jgi:serpin B
VPDPGAAAGSLRRLAGGLYGALPAEGNLVLSPYSVGVALGMTLAGAAGATAAEIRGVLGAHDDFHAALHTLTHHVEGLAAGDVALASANRLFGQGGVPWAPSYLTLLDKEYAADVATVDFAGATEPARRTINEWVAGRTRDRILELLASGVLTALTRLVLVDALHLKAPWQTPFAPAETTRAPFHRADGTVVEVDLMRHGALAATLTEGDGWRALRLAYDGGALAMTVVLPDQGRLRDVGAAVAAGGLDAVLVPGRRVVAEVGLPRWTFRTNAALADVLSRLGMPTAFGERADLTPMTDGPVIPALAVDEVVHEGFVAVDEHGTEAAAATAVVLRAVAALRPSARFVADRPFLFVIHDVEHRTPLFLGRVSDPVAVGAVS